jgi:hypothetical protein
LTANVTVANSTILTAAKEDYAIYFQLALANNTVMGNTLYAAEFGATACTSIQVLMKMWPETTSRKTARTDMGFTSIQVQLETM